MGKPSASMTGSPTARSGPLTATSTTRIARTVSARSRSRSKFDDPERGTPVLTKDAPALRVKTTGEGLADGQFDALVSVFGNVDSYGDVVQPGAFATTLKAWGESGYKIPVYWGHNLSDPDFNIGEVISAEETDRGLQVRAQLDVDSPKGAQVYRLLKGGREQEFSFGYSF